MKTMLLAVVGLMATSVAAQAQYQVNNFTVNGAQVSPDVSALCNSALNAARVTSLTTTYQELPSITLPPLVTTTYSASSSYPLATYTPSVFFRTVPGFAYGNSFNFAAPGYGFHGNGFHGNGILSGPSININNNFRGGFHGGNVGVQPAQVNINNNFRSNAGGGGGIANGISKVIGAVGNVLNSPAGLVAIGAGIGGAGPLGFIGGGNRGGPNFGAFAAARANGASQANAAFFAQSQRGRGR